MVTFRHRVRYHSDVKAIEVRQWLKEQPASAWCQKTLRNTTKGELIVEVLHRRIWLWDKQSPTAHCWHLIVRREVNSPGTVKYNLSNAPAQTSAAKLTKMLTLERTKSWMSISCNNSELGEIVYRYPSLPLHRGGTDVRADCDFSQRGLVRSRERNYSVAVRFHTAVREHVRHDGCIVVRR
jgi:hypothetical protein